MDLHGSAALSRRGRRRLVGLVVCGMTVAAAAVIVGCSRQTGSKWVDRGRRGEGLGDRSSRPHRSPRRVSAVVEQAVLRARSELREGPHVVGWATGVPASTVHAILRRHGCSRLTPGRLGRRSSVTSVTGLASWCTSTPRSLGGSSGLGIGDRHRRHRAKGKAGWQHLFVAIDDATRLAYAELYPDETNASAIGFLAATQRFYEAHRITIERVLTDNGTCFKRRWVRPARAPDHGQTDTAYRPQTNGKAERFIRTLLDRWATPRSTPPSTTAPTPYHTRSTPTIATDHTALAGRTPLQRVNDLSGTNI